MWKYLPRKEIKVKAITKPSQGQIDQGLDEQNRDII